MFQSLQNKLTGIPLATLVLLLGLTTTTHANIGPPAKQLPNMTFRVLPNGTNPKAQLTLTPLAELQGKPLVVLFWKIGDATSETELKAFQTLSTLPSLKGKVQFYTAVKISSDADIKNATKRARALKLKLPLIMDRNQLSPYFEAWYAFPRYGLINKTGQLRIWNCAKLTETVGPNMTFLKAIQLAALGKKLPAMRGITKTPNTYELAGKPVPNVGLDDKNLKPTTVKKLLRGKPTIIAFWSVTCPHCRQVIPAVAKYWTNRSGNLDMLTITRAPSESLRQQIKKLFATSKVTWPVAYAPANSTLTYFNIVKVPTILLTDKKGIIRYVWIQPDADWIGRAIENAIIKFNLY